MQAVDVAEFDRAHLVERLEPTEYFAGLLRMAKDNERKSREYKVWQATVEKVWREGDELWHWERRFGAGGPSGVDGLAVIREGHVVHA